MKHQRRQSVAAKKAHQNIRPALSERPRVEGPALSEPQRVEGSFLKPAILIFLVAAAIRLIHVWQIRRAPFFSMLMGDAHGYDAWALRIAGGEWFGGDVFYQAPLYPYFLGSIYAIAGRDLLVVRIVQALVGAAACTLLGLAAARLFSRTAGLVAGLALALYALAIFFDGLMQKSVLDVFFICLALWLMSTIIEARTDVGSGFSRISRWNWLFLGLAMGGLALTRENAMVLVAVILLWIALGTQTIRLPPSRLWRFGASRHSSPSLLASVGGKPDPTTVTAAATTRLTTACAFLLGLALVLLPVAVRNYAVGGGFYLTTSQFGSNFFIGNNPKADGTYMSLRYGRGAPEYERQDATELAEHALGRTLTPSEVSRYWTDRAMGFITSQPGAWLRLVGRKFLLLWNADEMLDTESQESYAEWSLPLRIGAWIGHFGILVPLAVFGMWAAWPDRRRLWVFYAMTLAYALSVIMFYVFARYRFPLVPFLMLFGAAGLVTLLDLVGNWRTLPSFSQHFSTGAGAPRLRSPEEPASYGEARRSAEGAKAAPPARSFDDASPPGSAWPQALPYRPDHSRVSLIALIGVLALTAVFANWPLLSTTLMQAITENNLAVAFQEKGQLDEAITHYQRSLALRPDYAPAHNNMGAALRAKGQLDEAVASYERALSAQPDYPDAHYNLANALLDKNKPEEAAAHFRIALSAIPASAGARNNLGIALANEGKLGEAVAEFRAALEVEPDSAKTNRNLGKALLSMGRTPEGIAYLRRAIELDPTDPEAHYDLGGHFLDATEFEAAVTELQAVLKIAPDQVSAHNNLGIALASLDRLDEAIGHFHQALTLQPDFADAKRNLAIALEQKKR